MTDRYWADTYSASDDGSDAGSEDDMLEVSLRPRPGSLGYEEIVLHSRIIADSATTPDIPAAYDDMYIN